MQYLLTAFLLSFLSVQTAMPPQKIYKNTAPAVVFILGQEGNDKTMFNVGAGSLITTDGHLVTNAHVILSQQNGQPYKHLKAYLRPDTPTGIPQQDLSHPYPLTCSNWDKDLDLALCKLENIPPYPLPSLTFSNADEVEVGSPIIVIGHPEGGGNWTMTTGAVSAIISNKDKTAGKDVFQIEAGVNKGNSGGPLLNEYGKMVGIVSEMARRSKDGTAITNINFALQSQVVVKWLKKLGLELPVK